MIGDLLMEWSRGAERRYRRRLARDLERLARAMPAIDAAFQPSRRDSTHDYDVSSRIRMLEAHAGEPCDMIEGIDADPAVALSDEDEAMFREAIALILSDQDHLSRIVAGR
jgi:hypothetical protein